MDPYQVLGVQRDAGRAEIRQAYLGLARRHHPDQLVGQPASVRAESERHMREVNAAWAILGDPQRRSDYDAGAGADEPPVTRAAAGPAGWRPRADDTGWTDDFEAWRDAGDDILGPDDFDGPARPVRMILPVIFLATSLGLACVALVLNSGAVLVLAGVSFALAVCSFFMLPILIMTRHTGR